jgi:hypothetical protein
MTTEPVHFKSTMRNYGYRVVTKRALLCQYEWACTTLKVKELYSAVSETIIA